MMNFTRQIVMAAATILAVSASAQEVIWSENHGGQYNESGRAGLATSDGGYLVLGNTYSMGSGEYDLYLVKIGAAGDTVWTRTYGGSKAEAGFDLIKTDGENYLLIGSTRSYGNGKRDVYLVKVNSYGDLLWSKTYGGAEDDEGRSIRSTSDGGFIIGGSTGSSGAGYNDVYLLKIDSLGDTIWTRTYGGGGGESGYAVREAIGGGYIAIGATGSFGEGYSSVYVVRVDAVGDSVWAGAYGGTGADFGYSMVGTPDRGFLLAGATASFGAGYSDAYLIKIDSLGLVEWERTYGGSWEDRAYGVFRNADGNYMLIGATQSFGSGGNDIYLVKIAPTGDTIWTNTYGGTEADYGHAIFQEPQFDYIVVGETGSYSSGGTDLYVIKVKGESTPVEEEPDQTLPERFSLAQNYPNPFNAVTTIEYTLSRRTHVEIDIYNMVGRTVRRFYIASQGPGTWSITWDGRNDYGESVASGIYLYKINTMAFSDSRKMVLMK